MTNYDLFDRHNGEFINSDKLTKRLNNFIDSVLSIIATIMIMQINLPDNPKNLHDLYPTFISISVYLLSFFIVMNFYLSNVRVFSRINKMNGISILMVFIWMASLSLMPFFTRWLINDHEDRFTIISYGILYVVSSAIQAILINVVIRNNFQPERNPELAKNVLLAEIYNHMFGKRSIVQLIVAIFLVIIAAAVPKYGVWVLIIVPIWQLVENALDGSDFDERKMSDAQIEKLVSQARSRLKKRGIEFAENDK
jgi:uncharacterized membrane protein